MGQARGRFVWGLGVVVCLAAGWLAVLAWTGRLTCSSPQPPGGPPAGPADGPIETAAAEVAAQAEVEELPPGPAWVLVGTVVASDPAWSRATIAGTDGATGLYRIGDRLADGARVAGIGRDWTRLQTEDGTILLRLARPEAGSAVEPAAELEPDPQPELADSAGSEPIHGLQQVRPGIYRIRRDALERRLAEPEDLFRQLTAALVFDPEGQVSGVRLGISAESIFGRLGLCDGDVLQRIGPLAVDSTASLARIEELLAAAREVDLELVRAGRTVILRYWLDP